MLEQESLFGPPNAYGDPSPPRAHRADPVTSHEAAAKVGRSARAALHRQIVTALRPHPAAIRAFLLDCRRAGITAEDIDSALSEEEASPADLEDLDLTGTTGPGVDELRERLKRVADAKQET
jgi:hypothetical protein